MWYSVNGMKNNRWNSVEINPTGRIPILVTCPQKDLDGVALPLHFSPPGPTEQDRHRQVEEFARLSRVREIGVEALALFADNWPAFKRKYGEISESDRSKLLGLLLLAKAISSKDARVLEWAIKRLATSPEVFVQSKEYVLRKQPGTELAEGLASGVRGVEFILWWKEVGMTSTILPGLRCSDLRSALYTLAVMHIEGGEGLGACLVCGKPFMQRRKTRKTCSDKCRYTLHMQRKTTKVTAKRRKP